MIFPKIIRKRHFNKYNELGIWPGKNLDRKWNPSDGMIRSAEYGSETEVNDCLNITITEFGRN